MSQSSVKVCKYYQTGFCKYKDQCQKNHDYQKCENPTSCKRKECSKRHLKPCRNYIKEQGYRFKGDCAYSHEDVNSTSQRDINNALSVVVTKHNIEMKIIQEEVKELKCIIESMKERLIVLEKEAQQVKENTTAEVQTKCQKKSEPITELGINDKISLLNEPENIPVEETHSINGKAAKKGKEWSYCEFCNYKCTSANTMNKHTMTKHKKIKKCTMCEKKFEDQTLLEEHMKKDHSHIGSHDSDDDLVNRMEQLQSEIDADYSDNMSDVSLDEERHEALDREMNPSDYS